MEVALEAGAQDIVSADDGSVEVLTGVSDFEIVKQALLGAGLAPETAEVTMRASTATALDAETAPKMVKLLDMLEDLDDVQNVYSNADVSDEIMEQMA
jgi:transcriptional/translational regulatory protein YebC/TACO1